MKKILLFLCIYSFINVSNLIAQKPVYPIIFIHGLNSSDETWESSIKFIQENFGWGDPYSNSGIFHAVLNAHYYSNLLEADVIIDDSIFKNNIYAINFKNYYDWANEKIIIHENHNEGIDQSQSNEAAIVKQAYALKLMIHKVLEVTGAEKVILFGHSMGGLAAREYLQRTENGRYKWWIEPDSDDGHKIAKLITIGTPHLGSNASDWGNLVFWNPINPNSEASRDLHYNFSDSYLYGKGFDDGVFLFGGNESYQEMHDDNFHNYDINCDGDENDEIIGLNSKISDWSANPAMPLPQNVDYSWIASDNGIGGDEAVKFERQYLKSHGDILLTDRTHLTETKDEYSIIRGLDEPDSREVAYNINLSEKYHISATYQSDMGTVDQDWLAFSIDQSNIVKFRIDNIPQEEIDGMTIRLYVKGDDLSISEYTPHPDQNYLEFYRDDLTQPEYYLQIETALPESGSDSWKHPFTLSIEYIGAVSKLFTYTIPPSIEANGVSKSTLQTEIHDAHGNLVGTVDNEITYTILSGQVSGTFVGDNPAKAEGGVATIQMQTTTQAGQVMIECSSTGLVPDTVIVYTYPPGLATLVSGRITTNTTWTLADSPYEVTSDVTVDASAVLTIDPGVVVKFRKDTDLFVNGGFLAIGTSYNPIIFASNGDQLPGFWGGIKFNSTTIDDKSALQYCEFYYGGSNNYGENAYPVVLDLRANPKIHQISINQCRVNAIGLAAGTYNVDVHLNNPGVPFWLNTDLIIGSSATLTIDPGILIKLAKDVDINISGGLNAEGTASVPIIFTSYKDDERMGDTNGDGASEPLPGDWGGYKFNGTTLDNKSALRHCEFHYAGSNNYGENAYPIFLDLRANPSINHLTLNQCRINAIGLVPGTYTVDVHLNNPGVPLWINTDLTIGSSAVLTIDPDLLIKLAKDVDIFINGGLKAEGTASEPIIFTSYNDDKRMGDTNGDGSSEPLPGDWGGIKFGSATIDDKSTLQYCEFYYGGSNGYGENAYPVVLDLRASPAINQISLNQCRVNAIGLASATYNVDVSLNNPGVPLWLNSDLAIGSSAILTIDPGILIKLAKDVDIFINGGLKAEGTVSEPIIFTSYKDDSRGGDTNGDGGSEPLPGDWGGIKFGSTAIDNISALSYCEFYYAGSNNYGENPHPLIFDSSNPIIQECKFNFSESHGIKINYNATPDLGGGSRGSFGNNRFFSFLDGSKYAVYNNSTNNIQAKNNFWGTDDPSEIANQIYDFYDNSDKGIVYFEPFVKKNTAPLSFNLLSPEDGDTIIVADVLFEWEKAEDDENDSLLFDLFIYNDIQDTLFENIHDSFFSFYSDGFFKTSSQYYWSIGARDNEFTTASIDTFSFVFKTPTNINDYLNPIPNKYMLHQNYPNPFNPQTVISYGIPKQSHVKIEIFNLLGQKLFTILDSKQVPGHHMVTFNSSQLSSGVYIYRFEADGFSQSRKMLLVR